MAVAADRIRRHRARRARSSRRWPSPTCARGGRVYSRQAYRRTTRTSYRRLRRGSSSARDGAAAWVAGGQRRLRRDRRARRDGPSGRRPVAYAKRIDVSSLRVRRRRRDLGAGRGHANGGDPVRRAARTTLALGACALLALRRARRTARCPVRSTASYGRLRRAALPEDRGGSLARRCACGSPGGGLIAVGTDSDHSGHRQVCGPTVRSTPRTAARRVSSGEARPGLPSSSPLQRPWPPSRAARIVAAGTGSEQNVGNGARPCSRGSNPDGSLDTDLRLGHGVGATNALPGRGRLSRDRATRTCAERRRGRDRRGTACADARVRRPQAHSRRAGGRRIRASGAAGRARPRSSARSAPVALDGTVAASGQAAGSGLRLAARARRRDRLGRALCRDGRIVVAAATATTINGTRAGRGPLHGRRSASTRRFGARRASRSPATSASASRAAPPARRLARRARRGLRSLLRCRGYSTRRFGARGLAHGFPGRAGRAAARTAARSAWRAAGGPMAFERYALSGPGARRRWASSRLSAGYASARAACGSWSGARDESRFGGLVSRLHRRSSPRPRPGRRRRGRAAGRYTIRAGSAERSTAPSPRTS